ncbi:hypothetical protein V1514DRAFT_161983 [Lipomyces japonicus]|uniref:uncharacterized protein n=1 Tax=Lipomyces japonicus TaxID=56871 RepID=UPI0034CFB27B
MTDPNPPDFKNLVESFLTSLPVPDPSSISFTPSLTPKFLSLLSPLLRARCSFNIQTLVKQNASQDDNDDLQPPNFEQEHRLQIARHQWAGLLYWKQQHVENNAESFAPIFARRLYESRDLISSSSDVFEVNGFARPDEETILSSVLIPETEVEIVFTYDLVESKWLVYEAKISSPVPADDGQGLGVFEPGGVWAEELKDAKVPQRSLANHEDAYWDAYDDQDDDQASQKSTADAGRDNDNDDSYYDRYGDVNTSITDGPSKPISSPIHTHVTSSIQTLFTLTQSYGLSPSEFKDLVSQAADLAIQSSIIS